MMTKNAPKFFIRRILCELVTVCTHLSYCRATASVAVFKVGRRSVCPTTSRMAKSVAIVGAGVSGLTCGVFFAEHGFQTAIFAEQIGQQTTSGAAAALWFPYDAGPADKMIPWALASYKVLVDLIKDSRTGVSMIELRQYSRAGEISIPDWAHPFVMSTSPFVISSEAETSLDISACAFSSGFSLNVPLMETTNTSVLNERVGLRPFRKSGVRLEREKLPDSRTVIHNYGHGGSGFTLSWGCAENVFTIAN